MPTYEYTCESCSHGFTALLKIDERDTPTRTPCPACRKRTVRRGVSATVMGADATKGPGADFKELTRKMGRGVPASARENLERAAGLRARKYGPQ